MNDTTTASPAGTAADGIAHDGEEGHEAHVHHPSDVDYVKVAIGLAVLTGIEIALSYIGIKGLALVVPLLAVMAIKFVIVGGQFMHLKFDNKLLTRVFYAGLVLAVAVYLAVLVTFHVFDTHRCPDGGRRSGPDAACVL